MSWITELVETYDACEKIDGLIGRIDIVEGKNYTRQLRPLTPLYHDLIKATFEVSIDADGKFLSAKHLEKEEQMTIVPCTQYSRARTGAAAYKAAQPLCERLDFICKDDYENDYTKTMQEWVDSKSFSAAADSMKEGILAVHAYIKEKTLYDDIMNSLDEATKEKASRSGYVRFRVENMRHQRGPADLSQNKDTWKLHILRTRELQKQEPLELCYATGTLQPRMDVGAKGILAPGDSAKIFPVNTRNERPGTGYFTCRGRGIEMPDEAFTIGIETAEKVQAMLRWLIDHQSWGLFLSSLPRMIVWEKNDPASLSVRDIYDFVGNSQDSESEEPVDEDCEDIEKLDARNLKAKTELRKLSTGNWLKSFDVNSFDSNDDIVIMMIDKPSIGRLSVVGYQKLSKRQYYETIMKWHNTAFWGSSFAPSMRQALTVAYGMITTKPGGSDLLPIPEKTARQLLLSINYGAPLPRNLVDAAFLRMTRTGSIKMSGSAEEQMKTWYGYLRQVNTTCALICKYRKDTKSEDLIMDKLDHDCKDRDYLYGRALAYFDEIERQAMFSERRGFERPTNAWKHTQSFYQAPAKTAFILNKAIQPYVTKKRAWRYTQPLLAALNKILAQISQLETENGISSEKALGHNALLGYACQMDAFKEARMKLKNKSSEEEQNNE